MIIAATLFGVYCFVLGRSGMLERRELVNERTRISAINASLVEENAALEALIRDRPGDITAHAAHRAGYAAPGERRVIFVNTTRDAVPAENDRREERSRRLHWWRTGYGIVSVCLIGALVVIRLRREDFRDDE
jgi:hypothetical protein